MARKLPPPLPPPAPATAAGPTPQRPPALHHLLYTPIVDTPNASYPLSTSGTVAHHTTLCSCTQSHKTLPSRATGAEDDAAALRRKSPVMPRALQSQQQDHLRPSPPSFAALQPPERNKRARDRCHRRMTYRPPAPLHRSVRHRHNPSTPHQAPNGPRGLRRLTQSHPRTAQQRACSGWTRQQPHAKVPAKVPAKA